MRVKNYSLKAAAIPRLDEGAKGIDAALQWRGEFGVPIDRLAGELSFERRGGETRRLESNRDAGGKNRIEKFPGIAEQRIAGSAERLNIGRVADDLPRRRIPARTHQQAA